MKLTIYAKTKKTSEGRSFKVYLSRLYNKRTGEDVPVRVVFQEGCTLPTIFPCNIVAEKADMNLSEKKYRDEQGEEHITRSLWIKDYQMGEPFEDHSLDDYE